MFHQLRDIRSAGQADGEVNVIRDATDAVAFALGVADNGGKIFVERRPHRVIEKRSAIFCTEDQMDKDERKRLRHRLNYRSGFQPSFVGGIGTWGFAPCWYKTAPLALVLVLILAFELTPAFAEGPQKNTKAQQHNQTQQHSVSIRIINAQTNKPVTDENLNVALRVDQIGSVAMKTDKNGIINVDTGHATIIRILSNMYADCRSRGELYTNYSIAQIRANGITTGNLCSDARPKAKPGELILFEIPKTYIPTMYPTTPAPKERP